jgi:signal peptidase I
MVDDLHEQGAYKIVLEEAPSEGEQKLTVKGIIREVVETAVMTLLIFLLVRVAVQNFRIEGQSMEANLHNGQFVIVNKLVYYLHPPQRGDVVVFHSPENPDKDFIKRVIGLPGEEVELINGRVYINGVPLHETYIHGPTQRSWGPETVGEFEYFVLGDYRSNSSDSRSWGMLDGNAIIGKAWFTYWPPRYLGPVPHYSFAAVE